MKKILFSVLTFVAVFCVAGTVFAADFTMNPVSISVKAGETFKVNVSMDPSASSIFTGKTEIKFSADLLSVSDFSFGKNWLPLSSTDYDSIDNTSGILIKTAGFPGGLTSSAPFGTIVFKAKKAGTAIVNIGGNSFALGADSKNALGTNLATVSVAISAPAPKIVAPTIKVQVPSATDNISPTTTDTSVSSTSATDNSDLSASVVEAIPQNTLRAAIGTVLSFGTGNRFLAILTLIIGLLIVGYAIYAFATRNMKE